MHRDKQQISFDSGLPTPTRSGINLFDKDLHHRMHLLRTHSNRNEAFISGFQNKWFSKPIEIAMCSKTIFM